MDLPLSLFEETRLETTLILEREPDEVRKMAETVVSAPLAFTFAC